MVVVSSSGELNRIGETKRNKKRRWFFFLFDEKGKKELLVLCTR